jgi:hypothetical protein
MPKFLFVQPAINRPIAPPAIKGTSVSINTRARGVYVNSQSIHRSHNLFINSPRLEGFLLPTARDSLPEAHQFSLSQARRRQELEPHLYQP